MQQRILGRSGIAVSAIGLGCWAIGGPWGSRQYKGQPTGWGEVDDRESIRAIHYALDRGVTLFDTSNNYGTGRSERVLGQALAGRRAQVVIATKFGYQIDEATREVTGSDASPQAIRSSCEDSLRRLGTDYIDLYQLHIPNYPAEQAAEVYEVLEQLVAEGKIRCYGWSTNTVARARAFAQGQHCTAIQYNFNIVEANFPMLELCKEHGLANICRGPLAMGILTGKFSRDSKLPGDDIRHTWDFNQGEERMIMDNTELLREVLTSDGRSLAQAAIGWLLTLHESTIPIPGFKTLEQVKENLDTLDFGPLSPDQMQTVEQLLGRTHS
ncbi:MAG TPA: aldo/keto reductase [Roseiflexaceae bacterium]|nr:aldo/keto reductase [Roseiflexaceae bacterium]